MPTYHYRCKSCGHEFEEFQSMSEDALTLCPECGKHRLVRVISGAGLVFKGSGFYLTDYKKPSDRGGSGSGAGSSAGEGTAPPAKGKPAAEEGKGSPKKDSGNKKGSGTASSSGSEGSGNSS